MNRMNMVTTASAGALLTLLAAPMAFGAVTPEQPDRPSWVRPYVRLGAGVHELEHGRYVTFAHAFGAELDLYRWLVLDLGYLDTGQVDTGSFPNFGLIYFRNPDFGGYYHNQTAYLIPMLRVSIGALSFTGGAGGGWVQSRTSSYTEMFFDPRILKTARTFSHWE